MLHVPHGVVVTVGVVTPCGVAVAVVVLRGVTVMAIVLCGVVVVVGVIMPCDVVVTVIVLHGAAVMVIAVTVVIIVTSSSLHAITIMPLLSQSVVGPW